MHTSSLHPADRAVRNDEALIVTDSTGMITEWSPAAGALYGWTAEEVVGHSIYDVTVPEFTRAQAAEIMTQLLDGQDWAGRFVVRHRNGSAFLADVIDRPVMVGGKIVAVHGWSRRDATVGAAAGPVLIVDDGQRGVAALTREVLLDAGYAVMLVPGADEALIYAEQQSTALIVFDYRINAVSGAQFYERLRSLGIATPVLLFSGWPKAPALAAELGVPLLRQPFDLDELLEAVQRLVQA